MKSSSRTLRYARYRVSGWLLNCFSLSNIIYVTVVVAMAFVVFVMHKAEVSHTISFFSTGALPGEVKRRELVVTTARFTPRNPRVAKCKTLLFQNLSLLSTKLESLAMQRKASTLNNQPKFQVIYTPKRPFPYRRRAPTSTTKGSKQELPPDIYRDTIDSKSRKHNVSTSSKQARPETDKWIRVPSEKDKVLVFSAYWDERIGNPCVRVMAIMTTKKSPTVYCRFKLANGRYVNATGSKKIMNEHWRLKYSSFFLTCEYFKVSYPPNHVYISTSLDFKNEVMLRVHNNKNDTSSPRGTIAVCVKPIHYNYDRAVWLLEFIEFHRLLGVDHFIFYNHTVGERVQQVLLNYIDRNIVSVLPWDIGIKSQTEIRTEGIFSSLNDCLFRTMYLFKYVIMLDFDEYIVPREHDTYLDLLDQLEQDSKTIRGRPGSFVFRNIFFYLYWENDTTAFGLGPEKPPDYLPYLLTQYKTRRLIASMKPGSRSKYIVIPERAVEVGNHVVWRHTSGSRSINVPDTKALLHHYRICEFGGYACLKKKSLVDQVALRFGPELLDRVRQQCRIVFRPEGKCPLSPPLGSPW